MRFHHIGIATEDIDKMVIYLKNIMDLSEVGETVFDEKQNASLCMVTMTDGTQIELISGPVVEKLVRKRTFLYHICYETDDLEKLYWHRGPCLCRNQKKQYCLATKK